MIPHTESGAAGRLDVLGLALLSTGSAAVVYGLSELGSRRSARLAERARGRSLVGVVLVVLFCLHALRVERPLLDIRLYANRVFAGASLTTFGLGAALFGAMILVPLYYQEVRHESVIVTGLLAGPQGLGALIAMPIAGRLTERFGGGRVAIVGVSLLCAAARSRSRSSAPHLDRGDLAGAGRARRRHRPRVHAGDDRRVRRDAPRAALRRDAAAERAAASRRRDRHGRAGRRAAARGRSTRTPAAQLADAFDHAYWWALGIAVLSLIPCLVLLRAERPRGTRGAGADADDGVAAAPRERDEAGI